jgi:hypothetical protein
MDIHENETAVVCDKCKTEYHEDCWKENGGCAIYGCENSPKVMKDSHEQKDFTERICPACKEKISQFDSRCPICRTPIGTGDVIGSAQEPPLFGSYKAGIYIFVLCLLGCTAPFALIYGAIWYSQNKEGLKQSNPTLHTLIPVGFAVAVFYLFLLFILIIK